MTSPHEQQPLTAERADALAKFAGKFKSSDDPPVVVQFGLRIRPVKAGDLSLRLKNGHAQDDKVVERANCTTTDPPVVS